MSASPEVTIMTADDRGAVLEMCHRLWEENGLFSFNERKVLEVLDSCLEGSGSIVGVIKRDGVIEASTGLSISEFYYTDDWHLAELWNFVDAPYRRSRNAEALIAFGMACSDKMKIPYFTGIITNRQMAGKVRLYRRLLGYPTGAFFVHGAKWKSEPMRDNADLRGRLRRCAEECNGYRMTPRAAAKEVAPLLREAAEALGAEDNIWGGAATPPKRLEEPMKASA